MAAGDSNLLENEVSINSKRYKLKGPVQEARASSFNPPTRTGNAERSDLQIAAEVIWDDLTGGLGIINMDERESPDHFSDSNAWTMTRGYWTPPLKKNTITTTGNDFLSTDFWSLAHQGFCYIVCNRRVKRIQGATMYYFDNTATPRQWLTSGGTEYTLTSDATGDPIVFKNNIYIPCGANLIQYNIASAQFAAVTAGGSAIPALKLAVFREELAILQNDGALKSTTDSGTAVTLTARGSVDTFNYLNGMVPHRNTVNEPALVVSTDSRLLVHDWDQAKFYPMGIESFAGDPDWARALTTWDGDLWHSAGANANQVVNGARVVRGPNVRDGLVNTRQGKLWYFDNTYDNYLLGVMSSADSTTVLSSVMAYNRKGWHTITKQASAGVYIHAANDEFNRTADPASLGTPDKGSAWVAVSGTWGLTGTTAYCVTFAGPDDSAVIDTGVSDCTVQVTFSTLAADAQVVFRGDGTANNYWMLERTATGWNLHYYTGAVDTNVTSVVDSGATNGSVVKVVLRGPQITAYRDGTLILQHYSTVHQTNTRHGIGTGTATTPRWEDFVVYNYGGAKFCRRVSSGLVGTAPKLYYNEDSGSGASAVALIKYVNLPDLTDNPEQFTTADFDSSGELILPRFDAGFAEMQKTALSVDVRVLAADADDTVTVAYALDNSASYTTMYKSDDTQNPITAAGVTTLYFDTAKLGTFFYNIRFKVTFASGAVTTAPKVLFLKLRYLREPDILYRYDVIIDTEGDQPDGRTPMEAFDDIRTAVEARKLVPFAYHGGRTGDNKNVLILQYVGPTGGGTNYTGQIRLSLVEATPQ